MVALTTAIFLQTAPVAAANDAVVAIPSSVQGDVFLKVLKSSPILSQAKLGITAKMGDTSDAALKKVLAGEVDLALVDVESIAARDRNGSLELTTVFTKQFLFQDVSDVTTVQNAPLGIAILNEISSTGVVALGYWNSGQIQLVTKSPLQSVKDFNQLKIGFSVDNNLGQTLIKFGAVQKNLPPDQVYSEFTAGRIDAAILDIPNKDYTDISKTYGRLLRPRVGVFVANTNYWSRLLETEKRAWNLSIQSVQSIGNENFSKLFLQDTLISEPKAARFTTLPLPTPYKSQASEWLFYNDPKTTYEINLINEAVGAHKPLKKKSSLEDRRFLLTLRMETAPVIFVTDRNEEEQTHDINMRFGSARSIDSKISCGNAIYQTPSTGPPPDVVHSLESCVNYVASMMSHSNTDRFLFFIHGFKNTFGDAIKTGVDLSKSLRYTNPIIVWSWPSDGWANSYRFDSESIRWSQPNALEFLQALIAKMPQLQIDFFAHSMGNRMLLFLLQNAGLRGASHSVTFAAPDEAQDIFMSTILRLGGFQSLNTLYASDRDIALSISAYLNSPHGRRIPRAGSGGQNILLLDGVESVDASDISSGIAHSYVFQEERALEDIEKILIDLKGAKDRGLEQHQRNGRVYWSIEP
jgi:TRAP-type C4-dicarboxylate transport system substrate-binding protein